MRAAKRRIVVALLLAAAIALCLLGTASHFEPGGGSAPRLSEHVAALEAPPAQRPQPASAADTAQASDLGVESCDRYLQRFSACEQLPPRTRAAFQRSFEVWRRAQGRARLEGRGAEWAQRATTSCDRAGWGWQASLQALGC